MITVTPETSYFSSYASSYASSSSAAVANSSPMDMMESQGNALDSKEDEAQESAVTSRLSGIQTQVEFSISGKKYQSSSWVVRKSKQDSTLWALHNLDGCDKTISSEAQAFAIRLPQSANDSLEFRWFNAKSKTWTSTSSGQWTVVDSSLDDDSKQRILDYRRPSSEDTPTDFQSESRGEDDPFGELPPTVFCSSS